MIRIFTNRFSTGHYESVEIVKSEECLIHASLLTCHFFDVLNHLRFPPPHTKDHSTHHGQ
jgi:hypothetical protein